MSLSIQAVRECARYEPSSRANVFFLSHSGTSGYLDIVPMSEGHNRIALSSPVDFGNPRFLVTGD